MNRKKPFAFSSFCALSNWILSVAVMLSLLVSGQAKAVTINVVSPTSTFRNLFGVNSNNGFGLDRLLSLGNVAADYWESLLVGNQTIRIELGFGFLSSSTLGASVFSSSNSGAIALNSLSSIPWFVDATPLDNSEFGGRNLSFADLGTGMLNTGIFYQDASGDAVSSYDAFTVLLHEIGHILATDAALILQGKPSIPIAADLPFAGAVIPLTSTAHIKNFPNALLNPGSGLGERLLPSDLDILYVASLAERSSRPSQTRYSGVNLNEFAAVPAPAPLNLMGIGLLGLLWLRYLSRRSQRKHRHLGNTLPLATPN